MPYPQSERKCRPGRKCRPSHHVTFMSRFAGLVGTSCRIGPISSPLVRHAVQTDPATICPPMRAERALVASQPISAAIRVRCPPGLKRSLPHNLPNLTNLLPLMVRNTLAIGPIIGHIGVIRDEQDRTGLTSGPGQLRDFLIRLTPKRRH